MEKVIGILGGMGPEATADFFQKIIKNTPAGRDQEHPRVIIYNNPKVPDRTEYLVHQGESPLPELLESATKLEEWGADLITIPCNTAHFFFSQIQDAVGIPVINMIELTADAAAAFGAENAVGLLATEGTVKAGVYRNVLEKRKIDLILPNKKEQDLVSKLIYQVKKGRSWELEGKDMQEAALEVCRSFTAKGAFSIILGCTELPILFGKIEHPYRVVDPTEILAKEAVKQALGLWKRP